MYCILKVFENLFRTDHLKGYTGGEEGDCCTNICMSRYFNRIMSSDDAKKLRKKHRDWKKYLVTNSRRKDSRMECL